MDKLPDDILLLVLCFATAPISSNSTKNTNQTNEEVGRSLDIRQGYENLSLPVTRSTFAWIASLRGVNHRWKSILDDDGLATESSSMLWFQAANSLGLDPPRQLYSGGTYQEVCKFLLSAEMEKAKVKEQVQQRRLRGSRFRTPCMMMMPRPFPTHPNPDRPPAVLPKETMERIMNNAKALETFLESVNFVQKRGSAQREGACVGEAPMDWSQSALNRYRMFLHMKRLYPSNWLVPTVDIEFCWIAHILRTETYWKDMAALGISDPSHSLCLQNYGEIATYSQAVKATASLWESTFGRSFPYVPERTDMSWEIWRATSSWKHSRQEHFVSRCDPRRFFPVMGSKISRLPGESSPVKNASVLPEISLTVEEIQADLKWFPELQSAFHDMRNNQYNVLGESGDRDELITRHILPSYERFLNLALRGDQKDACMAPPYVIDLIWHAHQLEPVQYRKDCLELFGREFWHHPWPRGLGVSSDLTDEFKCAWKSTYGSSIEEDWKLSYSSYNPV